jgi:hypothetical protein
MFCLVRESDSFCQLVMLISKTFVLIYCSQYSSWALQIQKMQDYSHCKNKTSLQEAWSCQDLSVGDLSFLKLSAAIYIYIYIYISELWAWRRPTKIQPTQISSSIASHSLALGPGPERVSLNSLIRFLFSVRISLKLESSLRDSTIPLRVVRPPAGLQLLGFTKIVIVTDSYHLCISFLPFSWVHVLLFACWRTCCSTLDVQWL